MSDGYSLVRTHNIFVKTNSGDNFDTPSDHTLEIPSGFIQVKDPATEKIRISLMSFSGWFNWTEVNDTNNQFVFTNLDTNLATTITLTHANYPLQKLARVISTLYPQVICSYIPETNRLFFNFGSVPHSIEFVGMSFDVMGFTSADDGVSGTTLTSSIPIKPMKRLNVYIRLLDVIPKDENLNLDNFNSLHLEPSNVLCSFPINGQPWQSINFTDTAAGETFAMWIGNPTLTKLHYQLTDSDGNELDFIDDYEIAFQVSVWSNDTNQETKTMVEKLRSIDTTLKQLSMLNYLSKRGNI